MYDFVNEMGALFPFVIRLITNQKDIVKILKDNFVLGRYSDPETTCWLHIHDGYTALGFRNEQDRIMASLAL